MNTDKLTKLREHLISVPDDQFYYLDYFKDHSLKGFFAPDNIPPCGTAGCVAGHCVILFSDEVSVHFEDDGNEWAVGLTAGNILDLTYEQRQFLFYKRIEYASKRDAISRIEWLLSQKLISDYPWQKEDGYPGY